MRAYFYNIVTGKNLTVLGTAIRPLLIALSFVFSSAVAIRLFLYKIGLLRSVKTETPVISVGNITWGGTGKTPLIEMLLRKYRSQDRRPALLTRGYGNDEEKVISGDIPGVEVLSGKNRLLNALSAQRDIKPDIFIMDDGFQHMRIKRDADIVTINATDPFGNGLLIPAGILREPLRALRRADIIVITKSDIAGKAKVSEIKDEIRRAAGDIPVFEAVHEPLFFYTASGEKLPLEHIKGERICQISGLADNDSFTSMLDRLGAVLASRIFYMDHHKYVRADAAKIAASALKEGVKTAATTEKDWVKLKSIVKGFSPDRLEFIVLKIGLRIKEDEIFHRRLSAILSG